MKIVAVMACPVGAAHTYMAAEALAQELKKREIEYKVETQGITGIDHEISQEEVSEAIGIILSDDVRIKGMDRFADKTVIYASTNEIIKKPSRYIDKLLVETGQVVSGPEPTWESKKHTWKGIGGLFGKN